MNKESHIQWAIYKPDNMDYYVSLNVDTLNKIKEGNLIKSKIVYHGTGIKKMTQRNLFIALLTDEEYKKEHSKTKVVRGDDRVLLKISNVLLDTLIKENPLKYEHRYDLMWNKMHFFVREPGKDEEESWFHPKSIFDYEFKYAEHFNPTAIEWDLFEETGYIDVYNKSS